MFREIEVMDTKSDYDDLEENGTDKSSKHRTSKDSKKSSSRREENDLKSSSKDKERTKTNTDAKEDHNIEKDRRNGDRDEREKDRSRDKLREKDHDREKYKHKEDLEKEKDLDIDRGRDKDHGKEKNRERDRIREGERDREKVKEREKYKDRERENDKDPLEREKGKERNRDKDRSVDYEKERSRGDRDKYARKTRDEGHNMNKEDISKLPREMQRDSDSSRKRKGSHSDEDETRTFKRERNAEAASSGSRQSKSELKERILKMREERLKKKSEGVPELEAWVNKSRKLEEKKKTEKEKVLILSKVFEEQDNLEHGEIEDKEIPQHTSEDLAGFKVLHGLDKVMEGGAVVLTLKDQNILADGDINQDVDMLENVEIGEQQRRKEAYQAAKKKTGIYDDKFNDDPGSDKKMLPQYDDSVADEGITLDERGRFTGEAEKKLEELRKKLQGASANSRFEDLSSAGKISSDYYTTDEMLQFKKPKKKKSLRKKAKIDLDALEAEAISAGLGDLGSRNDGKRRTMKEEKQKYETEKRSSAYQSAYAKADEASKALRLAQTVPVKKDEDENPYYVDEDNDDLYKSLERARNLELKKKNEEKPSGPQAVALLAAGSAITQPDEDQNSTSVETKINKVVFTEMEEFVWGLQLDEEGHKTDNKDVFMEEDDAPQASDEEVQGEAGNWSEIKDTDKEEHTVSDNKKDIVVDNIIHEVPVGKGLSGALKLLKERGTLKETVDWGGRNMDKKKSKLVGIYENDGQKEIRIERTDEFGRIMTPKEAFRTISHKFHGKGPGKMKLEKRQKQYNEEQKLKQMKNSDTPSLSVERMREAQAQSKSPYVVISGHVKPGQTSDPRSGFATVEKDLPGGLTPMLGDRKVDYFLGIKRNGPGDMGPPKNPRT